MPQQACSVGFHKVRSYNFMTILNHRSMPENAHSKMLKRFKQAVKCKFLIRHAALYILQLLPRFVYYNTKV